MLKQVGSNYTGRRDTADVAKDIRAEIRRQLPDITTTVRISRFSGGSAIDVHITAAPWNTCNPAWITWREEGQFGNPVSRFSPKCEAALSKIESILNSYNRQNIEYETDYFDVDFYGSAGVDWRLEQRDLEALGFKHH